MEEFEDLLRSDLFNVGPEQELRFTHEGMVFYCNLFNAHHVSMDDVSTRPDLLEAIVMVIESQAEYMAELPDAYMLSCQIQTELNDYRRIEIARRSIMERESSSMVEGGELDDMGQNMLLDVADLMHRLRFSF